MKWWCDKYKQPIKPLHEHYWEELYIEHLEDFYDKNPIEIERFQASVIAADNAQDDWNGSMPAEYEKAMKARLKKINERNKVDMTKYQSSEVLTQEQEEAILASLGMNLQPPKKGLERGEFEDTFNE